MPKTRTKEQSLLERGINFFNKYFLNLNYFSSTVKKEDQGQIKIVQLRAVDLKKRNTRPLGERLASLFSSLYPQDNMISGGNYSTESYKNNQHSIIKRVSKNNGILLSSFFGMPNDLTGEWDRFKDIPATDPIPPSAIIMLLLKNFFGWNGHDHSRKKIAWNIAKLPLVIAYHLLRMATKTLTNTLSLVTEFFPASLSQLTLHLALYFNPLHEQEKKVFKSLRNSLISGSFFFLAMCFKALFLAGRTVSSPLQSIRAGWEAGEDLGGVPGVVLSLTLSTLSMAMTSAAYIALLPFSLKIILSKAPLPIANFVANAAFTVFFKVLSLPIVPLLIDKVGLLAFTISSLVVGIVTSVVTSTFAIELVQDMSVKVKRGFQHTPKPPSFAYNPKYDSAFDSDPTVQPELNPPLFKPAPISDPTNELQEAHHPALN